MDSQFQKLRSELLLQIPAELKHIIEQSKKQIQTDFTLLNLERVREQKRIRESLQKMQEQMLHFKEIIQEKSKKLEQYDEQLTQTQKTVTILQKNANETKESLKEMTKKLNKQMKESQSLRNGWKSVDNEIQCFKQKFEEINCSLNDLHSKTNSLSSLNKVDISDIKNKMSRIQDFKWKKDISKMDAQLKNIQKSVCYADFDILANSVTFKSVNDSEILNIHYQLLGKIPVIQKQFNCFTLQSDQRDLIFGVVHHKYINDRSFVWSQRKQCIYYYVSTGAIGVGGKIIKMGKQSKKGQKVVMVVCGDKISWTVDGNIRNMLQSEILMNNRKEWVPFIATRTA